jgi:hypothetical protein
VKKNFFLLDAWFKELVVQLRMKNEELTRKNEEIVEMEDKMKTKEKEYEKNLKELVEKVEKIEKVFARKYIFCCGGMISGEGEVILGEVNVPNGRYMMIKNVQVKDKNEFALIDVGQSFSEVIVENETLVVKATLLSKVEGEVPTARVAVEILLSSVS